MLTAEDLAAYKVVDRAPVRAYYRGREVLTNPPPSAGGILIARALGLLDAQPAGAAGDRREDRRGDGGDTGRSDPAVPRRPRQPVVCRGVHLGGRLGSTTHIAVIDADGRACSVTCSDGSCSGVIVPGTGVHLNNMLGEQGPQPAGLSPFSRLAGACQHDVADDRASRRRSRAGPRQRRLEPDPLGNPADDHPRRRRRPPRCGRRQGAAPALRGRDRLRRAPESMSGNSSGPGARSAASATSTCSSAASRPRSAIPAADSGAAVTPGVAETRSWCNQPCEGDRFQLVPFLRPGDLARGLRPADPGARSIS